MKPIKTPIALAVILAVSGLTGCATSGDSDSMATGSMQSELDEQRRKMEELEQRLSSKDQEVSILSSKLSRSEAEAAKREMAAMKSSSTSNMSSSSAMMSGAASSDLFPPNAVPGHCYTRIFIPPVYKTETEKVLVSEGGERVEVIPGETGYGTQRVLVKEASTRIETIPATYKYIEEKIQVTPASERLAVVPAKYRTVTEKILVKPAHTEWKKGTGPISIGSGGNDDSENGVTRIDDSTGEIMCLIKVPAVYRTVTKRVIDTPATTRSVPIPAVYKTIKKKVVERPASTRTIEIPAVYKTIKVKTVIKPPSTRTVTIPPKYSTVTRRVPIAEGKMDWREILCKTNTTPNVVKKLQSALQDAGFYKGGVDGVIGRGTMGAVKAYQRSKGLPVGQLTLGTLKSLGVM